MSEEQPCQAAGRATALMTPRPLVARRETPVREVWRAMLERRFRHMPVVEEDGRLCGIVSQRDLLVAAGAGGPAAGAPPRAPGGGPRAGAPAALAHDATPVGERMQTAVDIVSADGCLAEAARHMLRTKHSALPVVDAEGLLVGILTEADFVRAAAREAPPCTCGGLRPARG